ncbi:hypothetical protein PHLH6_12080 [Pseudomonas sp. Seg1]|uniref:phage tail assembly chaperone n=1 Tax=Pseudomonas sp. Seg1 TaxID=2678259 RepID=UPI001BB3417D|nr:phage tail assembly chaperone [Pseudomonas sp. Seg1]BBP69204.1 hypothetical protein PHLH6_12080 [Pseudomonas sp. Seg1]
MHYSPSKNGFYDPGFTGRVPIDVVPITAEEHLRLLDGQSRGLIIEAGPQGFPILKARPALTAEQLATAERYWRDQRLAETDGIVARHRDEQEEGQNTTLAPEEYGQLQSYRRTLRSWPEAGEFPLSAHRPQAPAWLSLLPL